MNTRKRQVTDQKFLDKTIGNNGKTKNYKHRQKWS